MRYLTENGQVKLVLIDTLARFPWDGLREKTDYSEDYQGRRFNQSDRR